MGAFDIGQIGQGAAMQAASGIVGTGLGLLLEGHNDRRQIKQQGKLNDLSVKSQKELLEAQRQKELQMWQDTNYSAQIDQMKKAGVNPALLYGQSGGGGTTTGGSTPGINGTGAPSGGGEILAMQGMGLQTQMMQANIELAKSQANLNNVKAGNEGEGGIIYQSISEQTRLYTANIANTEAQTKMTTVMTNLHQSEADILAATKDDVIERTKSSANVAFEEARRLRLANQLTEDTYTEQVQGIIAISAQNILKKALIQSETNLNNNTKKLQDQQIWKMAQEVAQKAIELQLEGKKISITDIQTTIMAFNARTERDYKEGLIRQGDTRLNQTEETTNQGWLSAAGDALFDVVTSFFIGGKLLKLGGKAVNWIFGKLAKPITKMPIVTGKQIGRAHV